MAKSKKRKSRSKSSHKRKQSLGKNPFVRKTKKMPKKKKKVVARHNTGTNQVRNLTRVISRDLFGSGKTFREKDWAQKALFIMFWWFPSLLLSGAAFWIALWLGVERRIFKLILFPIMFLIMITLFLILFTGYLQLLLTLSWLVIFILNFIFLWWFHRFANARRISLRDSQRRSSTYARIYPNRVSNMPRVKQRGKK